LLPVSVSLVKTQVFAGSQLGKLTASKDWLSN